MTRPAAIEDPLAPWVRFAKRADTANLILLCFHHAGGGASTYRQWPGPLGKAGIDVWPIQLPGRESRFLEPLESDLAALTATLADVVGAELDGRPYAVYGHSAGAYVACAFALRMIASRSQAPAHVFVGASRPPSRPDPDSPIHLLPRERLLHKLRSYGGLPEELSAFPEMIEMALDITRGDLRLIETASWPAEPWLACPVTAVGGVDDGTVPPAVLPRWRDITTGPFSHHPLPGGHFLTPRSEEMLIGVIRDALG
ncbi:alpha/beta fold hydrolase [Nonomuraea sp. NPDC049158]|uniref:thioesterase II family protein n=1 Tax=Nonomuraea sp. NPDC049158 TaxID=3155649 RepID=UPI0033EAEFD0